MKPYYSDDLTTLYKGDCFEVMDKLDIKADLILTDAPYGMSFQSNHRIEKHLKIDNDDNLDWLEGFYKQIASKAKEDAHSYFFCSHHFVEEFLKHNKKHFNYKNLLVWEKNNTGMGDLLGDYAPKHELCIFNSNGSKKLNNGRDSNILKFSRTGNNLHPTEKPLDMFKYLISKSTESGDLVIDPFAGSGTTARACKDLGRKCIVIEKEEKYCDVIVKRLAQQCFDFGDF